MAVRRLVQMDGSGARHVAAKGDPGMNPRTLDDDQLPELRAGVRGPKCHEAPGHAHLHTLLLSIDTSFTHMPGSAISVSRGRCPEGDAK